MPNGCFQKRQFKYSDAPGEAEPSSARYISGIQASFKRFECLGPRALLQTSTMEQSLFHKPEPVAHGELQAQFLILSKWTTMGDRVSQCIQAGHNLLDRLPAVK